MKYLKNNHVFWLVCALLTLMIAVDAFQQSAGAEGSKEENLVTILIHKSSSGGVSPDSVVVKKGDAITWVNKDPEPVKIRFKQPLGIACSDPVNFYADLLGNYESGEIAQGSAASICLINAGTFDYTVHRLVKTGAKEPYEEINNGRIVVQ